MLAVTLKHTAGLVTGSEGLQILDEHEAVLRFPRFFPAVPIEAYLRRPVFHPNVDPVNGFVCLWDRLSVGDTVSTAVCQLQRVIVWRLFNLWADHVMQPKAAEWYGGGRDGFRLPLEHQEFELPEGMGGLEIFSRTASKIRRRIA